MGLLHSIRQWMDSTFGLLAVIRRGVYVAGRRRRGGQTAARVDGGDEERALLPQQFDGHDGQGAGIDFGKTGLLHGYDVHRILRASDTRHLATALARLRSDPLAGEPTCVALEDLTRLFVVGSPPLGAKMAGEAEALVGSPEEVTASTQALAEELVSALSDEFEG